MRNPDIAAVSLVIGGINWGLVAVADFDLVAKLLGQKYGPTNKASKLVYGLVGAAALYRVAQNGSILGHWSGDPSAATARCGRSVAIAFGS